MVDENQSRAALSPVKAAILQLRKTRAELASLRRRVNEEIAIVGIGCRFPGSKSPDEFWQLLYSGQDAVGPVPASRSFAHACRPSLLAGEDDPFANHGGYLDGVADFDAEFFGINDREAVSLDPQQRLLLEVAWEALEDAGQAIDKLKESPTGIFLGSSTHDYARIHADQGKEDEIDAYFTSGCVSHSVLAGRLSYLLGLRGPSLAIDTACSSSLVAIHLACQSLRRGESDLALAGGVNLNLHPENTVCLWRGGLLSKTGRCRTFDASADGFVRSEGCGVVVLKRLRDAIDDNNQVYAVICGSAVNHDGRSNGLTAPSQPAQEEVVRAALAQANIEPKNVGYVETHGTGTPLGDPIELQALANVLGEQRSDSQPALIGSVKTNLGHAEAAAGVAGLIKTVLALHHKKIPPHLHVETPNPKIPWAKLPLRVVSSMEEWPDNAISRYAGVSSFGFSGTNAHVVLAGARASRDNDTTVRPLERPAHILCLSAKSEAALQALRQRYVNYFENAAEMNLGDVCYTANHGRSQFQFRLAIIGDSVQSFRDQLAELSPSDANAPVNQQTNNTCVSFYFPDTIPRTLPQVQRLFENQPSFQTALDRCEKVAAEFSNQSMLQRPTSLTDEQKNHGDTLTAETRFAIQYSLAKMWIAWGIEPDIVAGQGTGFYVAACLANAISLRDGFAMIANEGASSATTPEIYPLEITLATSTGNFVEPGEVIKSTDVDADQPIEISDVIEYGSRRGSHRCLSFGATPTPSMASIPANEQELSVFSGASDDDWREHLKSLREFYLTGATIAWNEFERPYERQYVSLPNYPWQRKTYWWPERDRAAVSSNSRDSSEFWSDLCQSARRQSLQGPLDLNLASYEQKWNCLNDLAIRRIAKTLRDLKIIVDSSETFSTAQIVTKFELPPERQRLLERWLTQLEQHDLLSRENESFRPTSRFFDTVDGLSAAEDRATLAFDRQPFLLDYFQSFARKLTDCFVGQRSPLDSLFPNGSTDVARGLYEEWAGARYLNHLIAGIVKSAVDELATQGTVRILEIGAGTGATTAALMEFASRSSEVWFTDVSEFFLANARERFGSFSQMHFGLLDMEQDPNDQGFPPQSFDIVVASNVLHATRDIAKTVTSAYRLLAPGGILVLGEVTRHFAWLDVTEGLFEGWQRFADDGIRKDSPLLDDDEWIRLLKQQGFDTVAQFPSIDSDASVLGHAVFVARVNAQSSSRSLEPAGETSPLLPASASPEVMASTDTTDLAAELELVPRSDRIERLAEFTTEQVQGVLRSRTAKQIDRDQPLMDAGLDSLLSLEFRNRLRTKLNLATELPASLIFDYPTIQSIAEFLAHQVLGVVEPQGGEATELSVDGAEDTYTMLEELSDDEVERLLEQKLEELE